MINVWATGVFRDSELDELGNIARDFESKGVTLIGILLIQTTVAREEGSVIIRNTRSTETLS